MKLKKFLGGALAVAVMLSLSVSGEAAKKRIALMEVQNATNSSYGHAATQQVNSELETALVQSGAYEVVERQKLSQVMRELGLHQTGIIDGNSAIELGNTLGAEYSIFASVVAADIVDANNPLYKAKKGKVRLNFKFVDNKTGVIKIAEFVEGAKTVTQFEADRVGNSLIHDAASEAAMNCRKLIFNLVPVTATVVAIQGPQVYIDLGLEAGVRAKDNFLAYKEGKLIIHPVTKKPLGVTEIPLGTVTITDVQNDYCIGTFKGQGGAVITEGCKVKRVGKK